ncbi:MATE family efflux transporter [Sedimentibacter sp. zth1]|uniref:MATE family efflux transporter n=1 Tax=Sedimentibacter sp. zth1 TaxID=2816908 RepID=UPI001A9186ED|nr:MATE family efflux transporter [Sedimentibacter sp. zth1]QSX06975.1 MATE family efflux transporter [Sedimentibacter sp. zth1]
MKERIDLLKGNILSTLTKLAIPIMGTSLIQMAYNMTDMIWIGRVGSKALAAVGTAGMFMWLSQGLITLCRIGGQVKVGQSLGANDINLAKDYTKTAIQMGAILALLYTLVMIVFSKPLIGFFNFSEIDVINDARIYLIYISIGLVFTFLNQIITGLITATGNSKTPFLVNSVGLVVNIILDPILIFGIGIIPSLGVIGAAIATVLAQGIVFSLYVHYMRNENLIFVDLNVFSKIKTKLVNDIVKIGLPPGVQSAMFTIIAIIIARIIADFGSSAIAVQKVGSQIESMSWMTADGFASALNSFISQNYGANNNERAKEGYYTSIKISIILGLFTTSLLVFLPGPIFYIFLPEKGLLPLGIDYLRILGYSQLFMCTEIVTSGAFAAFGRTTVPSIINVVFTAIRIPMAIVLIKLFGGLNGIWWALTISSVIRGILLPSMFVYFLKKNNI